MNDEEELPLRKQHLPGGVWRLVPHKPYHQKRLERDQGPDRTPLIAAHQITPKGMYPDIDYEIKQAVRAAADYRILKKAAESGQTKLPDVPNHNSCLCCHARVMPAGPQQPVMAPEMIDRRDWRRKSALDENSIRILLANDFESRKAVCWPLVPFEEFGLFSSPTVEQEPEYVFLATGNLYSIPSPNGLRLQQGTLLNKIRSFVDRQHPISLLKVRFPFLEYLLLRHPGHLAAAGGSLTRLFFPEAMGAGPGKPLDVDIFFYGLIGKQPNESEVNAAEEKAAAILKDCVAFLCSLSPDYFRVENKEYVTNVFVLHPVGGPRNLSAPMCYQFIKRIYPTKDSIIGGFDLGPSMLLYDGNNIYGTEMGAWSIAKNCLVIDTARRSLTFEKRIHKLWKLGFTVVFPGIRQSTMDAALTDPGYDEHETILKIEKLFRSLGLVPVNCRRDEEGYYEEVSEILHSNFKRKPDPVKVSDLRILPHKKRFNIGANALSDVPFDAARWVSRASDYNDQYVADHRVDAMISSSLRCNNLDAVFTYFIRDHSERYLRDDDDDIGEAPPMKYEDAYLAFEELINNPQVVYDPFYRHRVDWLMTKYRSDATQKQLVTYFAEFAPRIKQIYADGIQSWGNLFIARVVTVLEERMKANAVKAQQRLKGLKWITQEPGRQWTSSIKPIREAPVDFYGVRYYTPFSIGMPPEVETILRLIWYSGRINETVNMSNRPANELSRLPRDVFKLLLKHLWRSYVYNVMAKPPTICMPQVPVMPSTQLHMPQFAPPQLLQIPMPNPFMLGVPQGHGQPAQVIFGVPQAQLPVQRPLQLGVGLRGNVVPFPQVVGQQPVNPPLNYPMHVPQAPAVPATQANAPTFDLATLLKGLDLKPK